MRRLLPVLALAALLPLVSSPRAPVPPVWADHAPGAPIDALSCGGGPITIPIGGQLGVPNHFINHSDADVIFTVTMLANFFFGPQHVIRSQVVPAHNGVIVEDAALSISPRTPIGTNHVILQVTSNATGATVLAGCDYMLTVELPAALQDLVQVPVRPCVIAGSAQAEGHQAGEMVSGVNLLLRLLRADDQIWLPQAHISFRSVAASGIPVIQDPRYPDRDNPSSQRGDIDIALGSFFLEAAAAAMECEQAWTNLAPPGIILVNARTFLNQADTLGITAPADLGLYVQQAGNSLTGQRGDDLCGDPRHLTAADVPSLGVSVADAAFSVSQDVPTQTLAHELGHALLLGHGNGLDDNHDGREPPTPGPRRYDQYCDPLGAIDDIPREDVPFNGSCAATGSLMTQRESCTELRPLQIEQARAVAKVWPGATFDPASRVLSLQPVLLPQCLSTPPVVNPGDTTRIDAQDLLPNQTVDVYLGDELIGSGLTDGMGEAHVDVDIPANARQDVRPVMVLVPGTAVNAACALLVSGAPLTPATSATLSPPPNGAGWNNRDVLVALSALDLPGGPGVAEMTYSASGAHTIASTTVPGTSATLLITTEGQTTITFFATNHAGISEAPRRLTVQVDKTPPRITGARTPASNTSGWNNTNVTVSFTCADTLSGVLSCSEPTTLAAEGANQSVTGTATDLAGNSTSTTVSGINIDKTPPVTTITQPAPTPYVHSAMLTLSYTLNDGAGSGVKQFTPRLDGATTLAGHGLQSGQTLNLLTELALGPHTFTVESVDNAGNTGTASVTFTIIVTAASIQDDVQQFLAAGKITVDEGTPLLQQLEAAAAARARGQCATASNIYQAFIAKLQAQSGHKVDATAAAIMIADAQYLIAHCP